MAVPKSIIIKFPLYKSNAPAVLTILSDPTFVPSSTSTRIGNLQLSLLTTSGLHLKYLSDKILRLNPTLGTTELKITPVIYVDLELFK